MKEIIEDISIVKGLFNKFLVLSLYKVKNKN